MESISQRAYAKINLILDVTKKRNDGYHELNTIMQTIALHDTLIFYKKRTPGIKINAEYEFLEKPTNIINKAYTLLSKLYQINEGLEIDLLKRIPVCAGLGGGSSDCAQTILAMRKIFNLSISDDKLLDIAKSLGADVPFLLTGGTQLAKGIGEILTPLTPLNKTIVVLAKPFINISTKTVFKSFRFEEVTKSPDVELMTENINTKNSSEIPSGFCNVLESVTEKKHPILTDIKRIMLEHGAQGVSMSGSGPTIFGFFSEQKYARSAYYRLKIMDTKMQNVIVTHTYTPSRTT